MFPVDGRNSPVNTFTKVDFPEPELPIIAIFSPDLICKFILGLCLKFFKEF